MNLNLFNKIQSIHLSKIYLNCILLIFVSIRSLNFIFYSLTIKVMNLSYNQRFFDPIYSYDLIKKFKQMHH